MKLPRNVMALAGALVVNVVIVILLTPLGFENRPQSALQTVGLIAIATIFTGLTLDVASFLLLFRRVRLASGLAIVASLIFFFPIVATGLDPSSQCLHRLQLTSSNTSSLSYYS